MNGEKVLAPWFINYEMPVTDALKPALRQGRTRSPSTRTRPAADNSLTGVARGPLRIHHMKNCLLGIDWRVSGGDRIAGGRRSWAPGGRAPEQLFTSRQPHRR